MRFAVTGAAGHLGVNVVRALTDAGEAVRAVDLRRTSGLDDAIAVGGKGEFIAADVLDAAALRSALAGIDVLLHLAARISIAGDPDGSVAAVNVEGVRIAAETALAAGVRRMVHCSSLHAHDVGAATGPVTEGSPRALHQQLPAYDRSKAAGRSSCAASWIGGSTPPS